MKIYYSGLRRPNAFMVQLLVRFQSMVVLLYLTWNDNITRSTQRAQTSADPEDPDFGLWTPGSEA